jgi:hypothetical protein
MDYHGGAINTTKSNMLNATTTVLYKFVAKGAHCAEKLEKLAFRIGRLRHFKVFLESLTKASKIKKKNASCSSPPFVKSKLRKNYAN